MRARIERASEMRWKAEFPALFPPADERSLSLLSSRTSGGSLHQGRSAYFTSQGGAEMRCQRCGRKLSNPLSVRRGIGPICWKKIWKEIEDELKDNPLKYANFAHLSTIASRILRSAENEEKWGMPLSDEDRALVHRLCDELQRISDEGAAIQETANESDWEANNRLHQLAADAIAIAWNLVRIAQSYRWSDPLTKRHIRNIADVVACNDEAEMIEKALNDKRGKRDTVGFAAARVFEILQLSLPLGSI